MEIYFKYDFYCGWHAIHCFLTVKMYEFVNGKLYCILWNHLLHNVIGTRLFSHDFCMLWYVAPIDAWCSACILYICIRKLDRVKFREQFGSLTWQHIDWLVQERRNSSALAMELYLSCTNPLIWLISMPCPPVALNPSLSCSDFFHWVLNGYVAIS